MSEISKETEEAFLKKVDNLNYLRRQINRIEFEYDDTIAANKKNREYAVSEFRPNRENFRFEELINYGRRNEHTEYLETDIKTLKRGISSRRDEDFGFISKIHDSHDDQTNFAINNTRAMSEEYTSLINETIQEAKKIGDQNLLDAVRVTIGDKAFEEYEMYMSLPDDKFQKAVSEQRDDLSLNIRQIFEQGDELEDNYKRLKLRDQDFYMDSREHSNNPFDWLAEITEDYTRMDILGDSYVKIEEKVKDSVLPEVIRNNLLQVIEKEREKQKEIQFKDDKEPQEPEKNNGNHIDYLEGSISSILSGIQSDKKSSLQFDDPNLEKDRKKNEVELKDLTLSEALSILSGTGKSEIKETIKDVRSSEFIEAQKILTNLNKDKDEKDKDDKNDKPKALGSDIILE